MWIGFEYVVESEENPIMVGHMGKIVTGELERFIGTRCVVRVTTMDGEIKNDRS